MILTIIYAILFVVLCAYAATGIIISYIDRQYQTLWYKEKAMRVKLNPSISNAELCEYYVMFCKRYSCRIEF